MKRLSWLGMLLFFCFLFPAVAHGENAYRIYLDGRLLSDTVSLKEVQGSIYVPEPLISNHLKASVKWNAQNGLAEVSYREKRLQFVMGKPFVTVGGKTFHFQGSPYLEDGQIMFPLDALREPFGLYARLDPLTDSLVLFQPKGTAKKNAGIVPARDTGGKEAEKNVSVAPDKNHLTDLEESEPSVHSIRWEQEQLVIESTKPIVSKIFYLEDPLRLVIEMMGAKLGETINGHPAAKNGEIPSGNPAVDKVRYGLFSEEPSTVRIVLDLNQNVQYQIAQQNDGQALVLSLLPKRYKIVIDPGHGGKDPGATSVSGYREKDFNLAVSRKIYRLLSEDPVFAPYMTREDDRYIGLNERVDFANALDADLFVSIHGNSYQPQFRGTEVYYWRAESLPFAQTVHTYLTQASGLPDRGIIRNDFRVVKNTNMPAVLLELGYLSNREEERIMLTAAYQDRVAAAVVAAIKDYLNIP